MRVHLLHGIHNQGESSPIEALAPYLTGEIVYPDYGYILGGETRRINPAVIGAMQPYVQPDDVMIGHSNGCAIIYGLLQRGVKMRGVVFINGALITNPTIPEYVKFVQCYYNNGDDITEVAAAGQRLGIVDPNWGAMGHFGYTESDSRVSNFCGDMATSPAGLPTLSGHSDLFTPQHIAAWGAFIEARKQESYG